VFRLFSSHNLTKSALGFEPSVQLGSTAVGVQTTEGVVLAVEKRITSPLLVPESIEKIMELDEHLGCAMSGLTADARTMINHARIETQVCVKPAGRNVGRSTVAHCTRSEFLMDHAYKKNRVIFPSCVCNMQLSIACL
jgi:20S proteasome alpha/beta subunit